MAMKFLFLYLGITAGNILSKKLGDISSEQLKDRNIYTAIILIITYFFINDFWIYDILNFIQK